MYRAGEENGVCGGRDMMKEIVKGMWQLARFLFVPRWGRSRKAEEPRRGE